MYSMTLRPAAGAADDLFRIDVTRNGVGTRVALFGELDVATARAFERVLRRAEDNGGQDVVIDLGGLEFMDASGLRRVLLAHERLGDRLRLLRGPRAVQRVFELTGTEAQLPFE